MRVPAVVKIGAVMAAVLIAVKVAGLRVAAPERIPASRIGIVPFETDGTQHAEEFAREIGALVAGRLAAIEGVEAVMIATRPAGLGTAAVNRQIRFNYQVGTLLEGRVGATGHRLDVSLTLVDTARDRIVWHRSMWSDETLGVVLSRVAEEIASAVVAEL